MNLIKATESDLPLMLAWRSNPLIYEGFYQQTSPLVWEDHVRWFRGRNSDWRTFIILFRFRPVGVVNIGQLDHWSPEIGYYIGEISLWGKGVATEAVKQGIEWVREYSKEHTHVVAIHTTIKYNNIGSIKVCEKNGLKHMCNAREGEGYWMLNL